MRNVCSTIPFDLRGLLAKPENIEEARALLAEQIGKITLVPNEGEYVAKGSVDFFGEMRLRTNGAGARTLRHVGCHFASRWQLSKEERPVTEVCFGLPHAAPTI